MTWIPEKKWMLSRNDQIIDLNLFESFWVECIPSSPIQCIIFGKDIHKIEWKLAQFDNESQAQEYLNYIYNKLE